MRGSAAGGARRLDDVLARAELWAADDPDPQTRAQLEGVLAAVEAALPASSARAAESSAEPLGAEPEPRLEPPEPEEPPEPDEPPEAEEPPEPELLELLGRSAVGAGELGS